MSCGGSDAGRGPNTERMYREALLAAGLWDGRAEPLPALESGLEEWAPSFETRCSRA